MFDTFRELRDPDHGLVVLSTDKFKTITLTLSLACPLDPANLSLDAVLPAVLARGCKLAPGVKALQDRLDDMFGASFDHGVYKHGDQHVLQFDLEIPNGNYLPGKPHLLEDALALLASLVGEPLLEDGLLRSDFLDLEREQLRRRLGSIINNKARYAAFRGVEALFEGEPFALHALGRLEDLPGLTPARVTARHAEMLTGMWRELVVVGDVDPANVRDLWARYSPFPQGQGPALNPTRRLGDRSDVLERSDRFDVQQSQLVFGFRAPVTIHDEDYPAYLMFSGVLGGYAHSKLFVNVREKASLAYSVYSRYDAIKGYMLITAGINESDREPAERLILEQLEAIARGEVDDDEMQQTLALIVNDYRELVDSAPAIAHQVLARDLTGHHWTIDQIIEACGRVTVDDVARLARETRLHVRYALRDRQSREVTHA
jgi:predicted Zn-dependent peptidase